MTEGMQRTTIVESGEELTAEQKDLLLNFGIGYGILCQEAGLDPCEDRTLNELIRRTRALPATPSPVRKPPSGGAGETKAK